MSSNKSSSSGSTRPSFSSSNLTFATLSAVAQNNSNNDELMENFESGGGNNANFIAVRRDTDDSDSDPNSIPHELREQDRFLPIANVARIMKKSIPSSQGKIAKDARECVQECVSEFISFITSEASDRCQAEKRKTINGEDILFAMSTLGFDNYVEPLKLYLQRYREAIKGDKQPGDDFETVASDIMQPTAMSTLATDGSGNTVLLNYGNQLNFS